jgi:hypothetical protein
LLKDEKVEIILDEEEGVTFKNLKALQAKTEEIIKKIKMKKDIYEIEIKLKLIYKFNFKENVWKKRHKLNF